MGYLFDSDVLSAMVAVRPNLEVVKRLSAVPLEEQNTSAINVGEMLFGAMRRKHVGLLQRIESLIEILSVVPFDESAARIYAHLRVGLEVAGTPLAEADLRIAATALAHNLTLVTGNERHFRRIAGLTIENWLR